MTMVPFRPPVSSQHQGGSTILDRIVDHVRKTFDSLGRAFVARPASEGENGQILALGPDGLPAWLGYTGSADEPEQTIQEVIPSIQISTTLANADTYVATFGLAASRHFWITATATAFATDQSVVFSETQFIRVSTNNVPLATHLTPDTISHTYGAGFTFVAATSGGDLTLNLSNASGTTYSIQIIASQSSARVLS